MIRLLLTSLFCFILAMHSSIAQTGVKFGFKAGYSIATQYGIDPADPQYAVDTDVRHGFAGSVFLYFPVTESFGIQHEFQYVNKGSTQNVDLIGAPISTTSEYKLNYFELPIIFRYTFVKIKDVGIYFNSGFALSLLLKGEYTLEGVIEIDGNEIPFGESDKIEGIDTFDYSFVYGAGADFNLFNKTCFFEYRQTIGWNTLMMPTGGGEEPAPLRNQDYILALGMFF